MRQPASERQGKPAKRGPRGDISKALILEAADTLLRGKGTPQGISLRSVAAEVGVATNALYTYFPSLARIWHDLGDQRLALLHPEELLEMDCRSCALLSLAQRGQEMMAVPGTLALFRYQPVMGVHAFRLSEVLLELTDEATIGARDAHDLLLAWFYGSISLAEEGWTSSTDEIRATQDLSDFPLIAGRADPDPGAQAQALLRAIGMNHTCGRA
nr:TetR/AcrR family transcriptional regulator [Corynebacterium lubricantis]